MQLKVGWPSMSTCGILRPFSRVMRRSPLGVGDERREDHRVLALVAGEGVAAVAGRPDVDVVALLADEHVAVDRRELLRAADQDVVVVTAEQRVVAEVADQQVVVVPPNSTSVLSMCCLAATPGGWMNVLVALSLSRPKVHVLLVGVPGSNSAIEVAPRPTTRAPAAATVAAPATAAAAVRLWLLRHGESFRTDTLCGSGGSDARNAGPVAAWGSHLRSRLGHLRRGRDGGSTPIITGGGDPGADASWADGRAVQAAVDWSGRGESFAVSGPPWTGPPAVRRRPSSCRVRSASARPAWSASCSAVTTSWCFAGACLPVVGEPLPYAALTPGPARDAARRLRAGGGPLPRAGPAAAVDARPRPRTPAAVGRGIPARLFQSVLGLLGRIGGPRPVVHVVEDLHWADRSTLDLLSFLAANLDRGAGAARCSRTAPTPSAPARPARRLAGRARPDDAPRAHRPGPARPPTETAALLGGPAGGARERRSARPRPGRGGRRALGRQPAVRRAAARSPGAEPGRCRPRSTDLLLVAGRAACRTTPGCCSGPRRARPGRLHAAARPDGRPGPGLGGGRARPGTGGHTSPSSRPTAGVDVHHPAFREVVYAELMPSRAVRLHLGRGRRRSSADLGPHSPAVTPARWPATGTPPATCRARSTASVAAGRDVRPDLRARRTPTRRTPGRWSCGRARSRRASTWWTCGCARPTRPG